MKKLMTTACSFVVTIVATVSFIAPAVFGQGKKTLVLTHVTVIDVTARSSARALKANQTVIVIGERITAVGETGKLWIPEGAQVIDATGKFLIPGLWDMHVHVLGNNRDGASALKLLLANGVTGVRDMGSNLERILALRQQVTSGSLPGPRMVVPGPIIWGATPNRPGVSNAEEARAEVHRLKKGGADFVKLYSFLQPDAFFAAVDEAKKQGMAAVGHVPFAVKASDAAKAGMKSIEHLTGVVIEAADDEDVLREEIRVGIREGKMPIDSALIEVGHAIRYRDSYNPRKLQRLNALFVKYNTWQCPTLNPLSVGSPIGGEGEKLFGRYGYPYRRYVPQATQDEWKRPSTRWTPDLLPSLNAHFAHNRAMTAAMHRAGVQFLAGTDSGIPFGFSLHDQLGLFVQAGFSPMEALQTATINPARYFGREKELGTIGRGKLADIVLLDANPLVDIGNTRRINAVIANGRYLSKEALQEMLAAVEAVARRRPIADLLLKTAVEKDVAAAVKLYREMKANEPNAYDFGEGELNTVGYRLLEMKKVGESIEIFKLNVEMYPDASNPYDSLGEAYLALGDTALAIKNYKRSVEIDPKNTNGIAALKKLGVVP